MLLVGRFNPWALYLRLRAIQPVPYAAFINLGEGRFVLSGSPELFLRVRDVTMQLRVTGVDRRGPGEAQATLEGYYDYTEMRGGTSGREPVSWRATLRQSAMGWRIVALQ